MLTEQGAPAGQVRRLAIGHLRTLYLLGNRKLAFVLATASCWNEQRAGCSEVLSVWVRGESRWSLLTITTDPVSLIAARKDIPELAAALTAKKGAVVRPATALAGLPRATDEQRF